MKRIRLLVAGISSVLLTVGYLASQNAYLNQQWGDYAKRVDQPPIVFLSLGLFLAALVFFIVPDEKESQD